MSVGDFLGLNELDFVNGNLSLCDIYHNYKFYHIKWKIVAKVSDIGYICGAQ